MFCTLKANNVVGEPYAFESTPPPFAKKRSGKMSKVACTNCRISKLRCSGDPGSCRRCFSKRYACEYPPPAWGSSGSGQIQTSNATSGTTTSMTPRQNSGIIETVSSVDDSIHDFGILEMPTPGSGDPKTPIDNCADHLAQELEVLRRSQQQHHHHTSTATIHDTYAFDPDLATDIRDLVFDSPISLAEPKGATNTSSGSIAASTSTSASTGWPCSCLQQAMSANEAVEIISWSQRDSCSDVYDILQQQKAALVRCEGLLSCQKCIGQPSYVMMLLSMYRKLMETLERVIRGPGVDEDDWDGESEHRKRSRGNSYDNRNDSMGRNGTSASASGSASQRGGYGISIRERRLDDDDESLVLRSLVTVRVKMLRRIVSRVDELVSEHNWPVHKGVCRELQSLLDLVSIG